MALVDTVGHRELDPRLKQPTPIESIGSLLRDKHVGNVPDDAVRDLQSEAGGDKDNVPGPGLENLPEKAIEIIQRAIEADLVSYSAGGGGYNNYRAELACYVNNPLVKPHLIAAIGTDDVGKKLLDKELVNVDKTGIVEKDGATGESWIITGRNGDRMAYTFRGVSQDLAASDISMPIESSERVIGISSLGGRYEAVFKALEMEHYLAAWDPGIKEYDDPIQFREVLKKIHLIKANTREAALMDTVAFGAAPKTELKSEEMLTFMEAMVEGNKRLTIQITDGPHGIWLASHDGGTWHTEPIQPEDHETIFSIGAGDAAFAGVRSMLGRRKGFLEALYLARTLSRAVISNPEANISELPSANENMLATLKQIRLPSSGQHVGLN